MLPILKQITNLENENSSQESVVSVVKNIKKKKQTIVISEDGILDSSSKSEIKCEPMTLMDIIESAPIQRPRRTKMFRQKLNIN